jgi:WD40 repeat protein
MDATTGACTTTLEGHGDVIMSVAFSPDSRRFAFRSYDKTVKLWECHDGRRHEDAPQAGSSLKWYHEGNTRFGLWRPHLVSHRGIDSKSRAFYTWILIMRAILSIT